jgi:hypothetical protein
MVEAGFADFVVDGWYGMFAPARTPRSIVDKLSTDINQALKAPESLEKWKTLGFDPIGSTPVEFRQAPEGRPRLLEADDRPYRREAGIARHVAENPFPTGGGRSTSRLSRGAA